MKYQKRLRAKTERKKKIKILMMAFFLEFQPPKSPNLDIEIDIESPVFSLYSEYKI